MELIPPPRHCGECGICCIYTDINEGDFHKPACTACPLLSHCGKKKYGCSVHGTDKQPRACKDFDCAWIKGHGNDQDRPDKNGAMFSLNRANGGTWIFVMDIMKNAHRTSAKDMLIEMVRAYNFPAIICDQANLKRGTGDYVAIKSSLELRSAKLKGKFIIKLSEDINLYHLLNTPI